VVSLAVSFAVPGSLDTPTGGYAYDRRIIAELTRLGCQIELLDLGQEFPRPTEDARTRAYKALARVPRGRPIVVDGLALGVLPEAVEVLRDTHPVIALIHHPLALETGLTEDEADALRASERLALAAVRHAIVTSATTARLLMADYGVAVDRITVAPPGTDRTVIRPACGHGGVSLLSVGALVPRKGHDVLLAALAGAMDLDWRLIIAGDRNRSPETAAEIAAQVAALGLESRVTLVGAVTAERLDDLYAGADLFVLASRFEGYGMAFADAIGHGLPVIGTTAGAIPETVPASAAILVTRDDVAALASALRQLIADAGARARLGAAARCAAARLPTWEAAAQTFMGVLKAVS